MRTWWGLASTAGADGRLEVVGADRAGGRHEIRSFFACGPPGRSYRQKTNLTSGDLWVWVMTSGDLWVWVMTSDDLWVWANSAEFDEILPDLDFGLFDTKNLVSRANGFSTGVWGSIVAFLGSN